jgi:hypothetical protein
MTTFHTALDRLAALSVTGVAHNYAIDAVPDALSRSQLPALLVLPGETQEKQLFKERSEGFQALAFSSGPRSITYAITHLLLVAPVEASLGMRAHLPRLVDLIDIYLTALGSDVTLSGALVEPARVKVEPGTFQHGGILYHGCAFRHLWRMDI